MRFVSLRDLRNLPGGVRELLAGDSVALTSAGKPIALLVPCGDDPVATERMIRRARAMQLLEQMQEDARAAGADRMTTAQVAAEVALGRDEARLATETLA